MEFFIADSSSLPKPHPRYAHIASSFLVHGLNIRNDEYELIDAVCDGTLPRPHPRYFGGKKRATLLAGN